MAHFSMFQPFYSNHSIEYELSRYVSSNSATLLQACVSGTSVIGVVMATVVTLVTVMSLTQP